MPPDSDRIARKQVCSCAMFACELMRQGLVGLGTLGYGTVRSGSLGCGLVGQGSMRFGQIDLGKPGYGSVRCGFFFGG